MQPNDIIGGIASTRIKEILVGEGTRALFGIMGLRPDVTSAVARHIASIDNVGTVEVFVHPSLKDGEIGDAEVSRRTATWYRNHPTPGVRATVFSVPAVQIRSVEQSLGHVVRIDESWLLERPANWAEVALAHSIDQTRQAFANVLTGLVESDLVVTPSILAEFCSRVATTMQQGSMLENAVRESLPTLRLPRNAGDVKSSFSADVPAARQFFQRLRLEAQPFLYRRTKDGDTLASGELRRKLAELQAMQAITVKVAEPIGALCDDRNVRDGQWSRAQATAAEIAWDDLSAVFSQTKKTEKPTFGQDTQRLFDQEFRNTLDPAETAFLEGLTTDVAKPGPKIDAFFEAHRERLKKNPVLYRRWEKLIFKKPIEVEDLGEGLLRLIDRVCGDADSTSERSVYIWLRGSDQASFWSNDKLKSQLLYLRDRYRGLKAMLEPRIVLDFGLCWTLDWEKSPVDGPAGTSAIEFEAFLLDVAEAEAAKAGKVKQASGRAQMTWRPIPHAVGYSLPADLRHLRPAKSEKAFLLTGSVSEDRRSRGGAAGVDLESAGSVVDVFGMSLGALANPERTGNLVCSRFLRALGELEAEAIVTAAGASAIRDAFEDFRTSYSEAIMAMIGGAGLDSDSLVDQANRFGTLFQTLREHAASEPGLRELVAPLLGIGCIEVEAKRPSAITAAWHPFRLAELRAKALQLCRSANAIVGSGAEQRTGARDFLESRVRTLAGSYYADLGRSGGTRPKLLAETQRVLDCSLLEEAEGEGVRNIGEEGAKEAVDSLHRISREYLDLRPHERSNFSIVLLGAESDDIPVLLAKSLSRLVDESPDVRCDLVVTHDDPLRLRDLYESQNRRMAVELNLSSTSALSSSFLSKLRISLVSPERLSVTEDGKGSDLVLLQDVIARSASVRWIEGDTGADPVDFDDHMPTSRSKRLPFRRRSVESGLYLTAPLQPEAVVAWTNALHDVIVKQVTSPSGPWLPLRWVEFEDTGVADVLHRAHSLANWVVTFDRIADRRLIVQDDRRIIRYFSTPNSAHNVIVSAEITSRDLGDRLNADLAQLLPDTLAEDRSTLLGRLHAIAARLSGAVVMRAAQWRNYAQELLGLVLAVRRLEGLFGSHGEHATAWFFLDDNRQWLDLKGEMADILAVDFSSDENGPLIRAVVAEAKYCTASNVAQHRVTSMRQLEATYTELNRRLLLLDASLDPSIWRNRIADMLLEQMDPFDTIAGMTQAEWIEALRKQSVRIEVSGHSMVFSYDLAGHHAASPILPDEDLPAEERRSMAQWVHGRAEVVELLLSLGTDGVSPTLPLPHDWGSRGTTSDHRASPTVDAVEPSIRSSSRHGEGAGIAPVALAQQEGSPSKSAPFFVEGPLGNASVPFDAAADIAGANRGVVGEDRLPPVDPDAEPARGEPGVAEPAIVEGGTPLASGWRTPIHDALVSMGRADNQANGHVWLTQKIVDLQNALQAEGMDAPIIESRLTPNSGLVYVGARQLTVGWLERRQTDLLTKHRIEIVRVSPMAGSIAIAIRRPERSILHLADAWMRRTPSNDAGPAERFAPLIGEKEDDGALLYLPLAGDFGGQERAAPHSLVSGNTGSGKGILVTNLMLELCALNSPRELDLYLIDPKKGVDYAWARRLPHLRGGIIADQAEAVLLFERLVAQMEERYDLISERGFRNIDQYNRRVGSDERLPRVVIFFDEVANWMQDDDFKKEVEALLNKIATKARAAGLHLFMIYQRADVQVMTMQLRTNLGNRLILRLPDEGSSKIALGEKGADRLLGKGHLIAKLDSDEKIYTQVPFIGDEEVEELVDAIAGSWVTSAAD